MRNDGAHTTRILGRRLASETTRQELERTAGSECSTMTLRYPPDLDLSGPQMRL